MIRPFVVCVVLSFVLFRADADPAAPAEMRLTVVDATSNAPIQGASVRFEGFAADIPIPPPAPGTCGIVPGTSFTTDSNGQTLLPLGNLRGNVIRIKTSAPNKVAHLMTWMQLESGLQLPRELTIKLEPARVLKGVARNTKGEPVANAIVTASLSSGDSSAVVHDSKRVNETVNTNASGQFELNTVPLDVSQLQVSATHPDYTPASPRSVRIDSDGVTIAFQEGRTVSGMVCGQNDKPLAGADVYSRRAFFADDAPFKTDDQGRFSLTHLSTTGEFLVIKAKGHAPACMLVSADGSMMTCRLLPAKPMTIKVVNTAGEPLADSMVQLEPMNLELAGLPLDVLYTNAKGETSVEISEGVTKMRVDRADYCGSGPVNLDMNNGTATIKLVRAPLVKVSAHDSATGEALPAFDILALGSSGYPRCLLHAADGQADVPYAEEPGKFRIRIAADGFTSFTSDEYVLSRDKDPEPIVLDVRLTKSEAKPIPVVSANGTTATGLEVTYVDRERPYAAFRNGRLRAERDLRIPLTPSGEVMLPQIEPPFKIIAVANEGFAVLSDKEIRDKTKIELQPWARIDGQVKIGSEIAQNCPLKLQDTNEDVYPPKQDPHPTFTYEAISDTEGHFIFDRVIPGEYALGPGITGGPAPLAQKTWISKVEAGSHTTIQLGGNGAKLIGRLTMPQGVPEQAKFSVAYLIESVEIPRPQGVPNWNELSERERYDRAMQWMRSPEAEGVRADYEAARRRIRTYISRVESGGRFTFNDVAPGNYKLTSHVLGDNLNRTNSGRTTVATVSEEVSINQEAGEVDLGERAARLTPRRTPPTSQPTPAAPRG